MKRRSAGPFVKLGEESLETEEEREYTSSISHPLYIEREKREV